MLNVIMALIVLLVLLVAIAAQLVRLLVEMVPAANWLHQAITGLHTMAVNPVTLQSLLVLPIVFNLLAAADPVKFSQLINVSTFQLAITILPRTLKCTMLVRCIPIPQLELHSAHTVPLRSLLGLLIAHQVIVSCARRVNTTMTMSVLMYLMVITNQLRCLTVIRAVQPLTIQVLGARVVHDVVLEHSQEVDLPYAHIALQGHIKVVIIRIRHHPPVASFVLQVHTRLLMGRLTVLLAVLENMQLRLGQHPAVHVLQALEIVIQGRHTAGSLTTIIIQ